MENILDSIAEMDSVSLAVLTKLDKSLQRKPDVFRQISKIFIEKSKVRIRILQNALNDKDYKAVEQIAHTIKSSASLVGALRLIKLSEAIEQEAPSQDRLKLLPLIESMIEEVPRVIAIMKNYHKKSDIPATEDTKPNVIKFNRKPSDIDNSRVGS